ncbi:hypothetical protein CMK14_25930, partial [Candidatus Poribacteria bacterium]|nr:hypothetical protein [Candidatus Poribacteria bacterium]
DVGQVEYGKTDETEKKRVPTRGSRHPPDYSYTNYLLRGYHNLAAKNYYIFDSIGLFLSEVYQRLCREII